MNICTALKTNLGDCASLPWFFAVFALAGPTSLPIFFLWMAPVYAASLLAALRTFG